MNLPWNLVQTFKEQLQEWEQKNLHRFFHWTEIQLKPTNIWLLLLSVNVWTLYFHPGQPTLQCDTLNSPAWSEEALWTSGGGTWIQKDFWLSSDQGGFKRRQKSFYFSAVKTSGSSTEPANFQFSARLTWRGGYNLSDRMTRTVKRVVSRRLRRSKRIYPPFHRRFFVRLLLFSLLLQQFPAHSWREMWRQWGSKWRFG